MDTKPISYQVSDRHEVEVEGLEVSQEDQVHDVHKVRRLWLVRHGETVWNIEKRYFGQCDIELAESGRVQARWIGEQLRPEKIAAIYTSDLARARETAEIVSQSLTVALPVHVSDRWRELSFGDWEGLTYAEIAAQYPGYLDFFTDPVHHAPPQGETFIALVQRVRTAFRQLAHDAVKLPDGDLVLVSHGGVMRALLCSILGMPFERQWQLRIVHGSLSAIDFLAEAEDVLATAMLATLNQHAVQCIR